LRFFGLCVGRAGVGWETCAETGDDASLFNYSYGMIVVACKINTGSVLILRALSSVFLAVTEKHVPRLVMILYYLIILME
jgi:hypothetical protein